MDWGRSGTEGILIRETTPQTFYQAQNVTWSCRPMVRLIYLERLIFHCRFVPAGQLVSLSGERAGKPVPLATESPYTPVPTAQISWIHIIQIPP